MPRLFYTGDRDNVGLERWANDMDTSVQSIQRQLAQSREQAAKALTQAATTNAALGLPSQPTNFSINATEYYQDGSTYEQITATYTAPTPLGTFAGVFIVVSGYNGSTTPVKVAEDSYTGAAGGSQSVVFKLYRTGENVTFYAVPRNHNNAAPTPWTNSPYATHILGDVTAPAAPTGLAATNQPGGVSLTWNANTEKNLGAYKIYRNRSNSFSGASLIDVIGVPRSGTPSDFDPTAVPNTQYYYFVTAVNTADMEGSNSASAGILATVAATLGSVTGTQRNRVPDSDLKLGTAYWFAYPSVCTLAQNYTGNGAPGSNAFKFTGTGQEDSAVLTVTPGETVTLSGFIDATGCASGDSPNWNLWYPQTSSYGSGKNQTVGTSGRVQSTFTIPAGVTEAQVICGGTIHGTAYFSCPQLESGNVMTKYVPNALDDATGGLALGIPVQSLGGSLGLQIGDVHDRANNAIDTGPNGYLIKGGLVRWRALGGDTSGDTTADLVDAANKRFLHTAMSGGVRGVIDTTGYIYPASGLGTGYNANLGLIHDQATMPVVCPVTGATALPASPNPTEFTPAFSVPSWLSWTAYVNGTIADVVVDCGSSTGYMFRLDGRSGNPTGAILRASNFGAGTSWAAIAGGANNAANVTGWHLIQAWIGRGGFMQLYIDGNLICYVTDTTYTPNGRIWGMSEVGAASIGAASAATPDPTQLDGNARALIDATSAHVNWTQDHLPDGSIFIRQIIRPGAGQNVIDNGDFEASTTLVNGAPPGWKTLSNPTGGTPSYQTNGQYAGTQSLEIACTAQWQGVQQIHQIPVVPGEVYYVSCQAATNSGGSAALIVVCQDKNNSDLTPSGGFVNVSTSSTTYVLLSGTLTVPANAVSLTLRLQNAYAGANTVFFDVVRLVRAANLDNEVDDGSTYARAAASQLDSNGIVNTIGYSGHTQMTIGQGTIALTTGGASAYQVKKTLYTAPTGTEANGTVISFSSLTDQAGNALPTFDTAPLVALQPYDMSTPPVLLYASGTTTTGFTLNSYSAATSKSGPGGTLVNGTDLTLTADAGTTFTGVSVTCSMTTKNITPYHPNVVQTFAISINDVSVGTISVSGAATGAEYQKSQNFSISGNPTSVKVSATWTLNGDASSASATVTSTEISNPTAVSANIVCAISELWN